MLLILNMNSLLSKITVNYLKILGGLIKTTRLDKKYTQTELSNRANCSRQTIAKIEAGDPKTAIGTYFEICYVLGIPLFVENETDLAKLSLTLNNLNSLLPQRIKHKQKKINNDF